MNTQLLDKQLTGIERMQRFKLQPQRAGMAENLGYDVDLVSSGFVRFCYSPHNRHLNLIGSLHGGVVAALLDAAMGAAVMTKLGPGEGHTMTDLSIKFIRAVRQHDEKLIIEGPVDHCGKRLFSTEGDIHNGDGKIIARAIASAIRL